MSPSTPFQLRPIGVVRGGRRDVTDDRWGDVEAVIELDPDLVPVEATTGLDAVAGSPVFDLKPWMAEFGPRGEVRQPAWATELMRDYYTAHVEDRGSR